MGKLFGTDGIRGIANKELTPILAYDLGRAVAYFLTKQLEHTPQILIGTDTRLSCDMLESALISGIASVGAIANIGGVLPTPAVSYLVKKYNLDAGIVISSSHNKFMDNGLKVFNGEGNKLSDEFEDEIESLIFSNTAPIVTHEKIGYKKHCDTALQDYIDHLVEIAGTTFEEFNIALDCANGASYKSAPICFNTLKANIDVIHDKPNGININEDCGSTHPEKLQEYVVKNKMDVGFAFDGDADRLIAIDENGKIVDGDRILAILSKHMKANGKLKNNALVSTVMSNVGLEIFCKNNDIKNLKTQVGDRYVLQEILKGDYSLGGEQSGHIIFKDHANSGDGLLTAIKIMQLLKQSGEKLSSLCNEFKEVPQILINVKVKHKYEYLEIPELKEAIDKLEMKYMNNGRVLIRPSGTENLIRIMISAENEQEIMKDANDLKELFEKHN